MAGLGLHNIPTVQKTLVTPPSSRPSPGALPPCPHWISLTSTVSFQPYSPRCRYQHHHPLRTSRHRTSNAPFGALKFTPHASTPHGPHRPRSRAPSFIIINLLQVSLWFHSCNDHTHDVLILPRSRAPSCVWSTLRALTSTRAEVGRHMSCLRPACMALSAVLGMSRVLWLHDGMWVDTCGQYNSTTYRQRHCARGQVVRSWV